MSFISNMRRAFSKLDTTEADAAIALAARSQRDVQVRARALRMDVSCGNPGDAIDRIAGNVMAKAGHMLRAIYHPEPVPEDMRRRLDEI
jgi:hypothetical protein